MPPDTDDDWDWASIWPRFQAANERSRLRNGIIVIPDLDAALAELLATEPPA